MAGACQESSVRRNMQSGHLYWQDWQSMVHEQHAGLVKDGAGVWGVYVMTVEENF